MISLNRKSLQFAVFLLFLAGFSASAFAHPHVWISYYVKVLGDEKGITALRFRWEVDPMFTEMVKGDFKLKTITEKDSAFIKSHAFDNLKNYHYYMDIKADGAAFVPKEVQDFKAREIGDKEKGLEYDFTVKLPHPVKKLVFSLFDPEFYVDIEPPMQEVSPDKPGIMATASYKPKEFIDKEGVNPNAFVCEAKDGKPRESIWGTFPVVVVSCVVGEKTDGK